MIAFTPMLSTGMQSLVYNRSIFNLFAGATQQPCLLCGTSGHHALPICTPCRADLPQPPYCCARCALPLPKPPSNAASPTVQICGQCSIAPPIQDRCLAAFQYGFPIRELITTLKFQHQMVYGRALGTLLGDFLVNQYQEQPYPDAIVAVPLSRARLKQRGFNQAEVIVSSR